MELQPLQASSTFASVPRRLRVSPSNVPHGQTKRAGSHGASTQPCQPLIGLRSCDFPLARSMKRITFPHIVVRNEGGSTLGDFLNKTLKPAVARAALGAGDVRVNGKRVRDASFRLLPGDRIEYRGPTADAKKANKVKQARLRFNIVHEDDDVIVVHKGPDLLSVPDRTDSPAVSRQLADFIAERDGPEGRVYPVHRLDKDVTGLLLFAKTLAARDRLREAFAEDAVKRTYLACIWGSMRKPSGTIRSHLDTKSERVRSVAPGQGAPAVTHYRTLQSNGRVSLLEVRLETGRKNQIRVHLSEAGHALLGDRRFGGAEGFGFNRRKVALHAWKLRFRHPTTGRTIEVEDPAPANFERALADAR